jgi:hypothetical protein
MAVLAGALAGRALSRLRCQDARMGLGRSLLFRVATSTRLERGVKRVPGGERAAWRSASRYVASKSLGGALATVEQLLGVRPEALDELHEHGAPTRVYVPYGADWFRYWMRRLVESRGA